jgi:hypothetical protein
MTVLVWDQPGERIFQTGIDRGVLYLQEGPAVGWNGLTEVEDSTETQIKSFFLDGVKFLENSIPGAFSGSLKALTYPDEFDSINGIGSFAPGLNYHEQPAKSFNLSYRTLLGDDLEGTERGYIIHILYNILANPDSKTFSSLSDQLEPVEFGWALSGTPPKNGIFRPTVHVSIDSVKTPPDVLTLVENHLYGTSAFDASLPSVDELALYFGYSDESDAGIVIVDHGDGTWSAIDDSDEHITMLDSTTFQIEDATAFYLNLDTYQIFSSS